MAGRKDPRRYLKLRDDELIEFTTDTIIESAGKEERKTASPESYGFPNTLIYMYSCLGNVEKILSCDVAGLEAEDYIRMCRKAGKEN